MSRLGGVALTSPSLHYTTCRCAWRNMVAVQNLEGEIIQLVLSWKEGGHVPCTATPPKQLIGFFSDHISSCTSAGSVLQLCKVSQKSNRPFRRSCTYKEHDPPFHESISFFMKLYTVVVHNLQMCMKEYRCCLKCRRGDNSTYTFMKRGVVYLVSATPPKRPIGFLWNFTQL
jgi:hypothetical protein